MKFKNGFFIGLKRMHCNHVPSKGFVLASYHHPKSLTWRWSVNWYPHLKDSWRWPLLRWDCGNVLHAYLRIPLIGDFQLSTQQHMFEATP